MRFERLFLQAFGPFTDLELDLSGGGPGGLHVIYGPNEAGKSTSLRAVRGLLFGIPHRSPDAHLHPSNKLSVGARLTDGARAFELVRLKRRKENLVDFLGNSVSPDPIPELLGNLDETSFSSRFGLDQVELQRGAEALLAGSEHGLFAAGTAGAEAQAVLESLQQESSELYLPRGKVPRLNRAALAFETASREAKRAERPPEKWLEQERVYKQAKQRVAQLKEERAEVRRELRRLQRLRSLMSDLTAWSDVRERLRALGNVPVLDEDAPEKRRLAERRLQEADVEARRIRQELEAFESELAALPSESSLIEVDDQQLDLSTRVGTARSAEKDMPKRQASLIEHTRQLSLLLRDLGRDVPKGEELPTARAALLSAQMSGAVQRLLTRHGALVNAAEAAESEVRKLETERVRLDDAQRVNATLSEVEILEAAVAEAQERHALVMNVRQQEQRAEILCGEAEALRRGLGVSLPWRELADALPPAEATTARIRKNRECRARVVHQAQLLERAERELAETKALLPEEGAFNLPSEEKLVRARLTRDLSLSRTECEPSSETFETLRGEISSVDEISDRLRREADRIAEVGSINRQVRLQEEKMEAASQELVVAESRLAEGSSKFEAWARSLGIQDVPPLSDAEPWFARLQLLIDRQREADSLRLGIERNNEEILRTSRSLGKLLGLDKHEDLTFVVALGKKRLRSAREEIERARQLTARKVAVTQELAQALERRGKSADALCEWKEAWAKALAPLGLPGEASIERAQEALTILEKVSRLVEGASALEGRILGMERDTQRLASDVKQVAERHKPELLQLDPVEAAVRLQEEISAARRASEERNRLRDRIESRRASLAEAEGRAQSATSLLAGMVQTARVSGRDELPKAEEDAREVRSLTQKKGQLERALRDSSGGAGVEELLDEAKPWRGGQRRLVHQVDSLDERAGELDEALRAAESDAEGTKLGLETYGSDDVVLARQAAATRAAEARAALREYLVLKTAYSLLNGQAESYAARFRGPIAGRAGALFERLTLGRYSGLKIGVGEKTIRCVQDTQQLEVHELSSGTRAQLYFALRLASLEHHFQSRPAIPLIFDDLFVEFDDDRATVAFEILSELAERVQILYFTHLARDVEAAHNAVGSRLLSTHSIGVN